MVDPAPSVSPIHSPAPQPGDPDQALRPKSLAEFIGQEAAG